MTTNDNPITAVLLISPSCPHCAAQLEILSKLVKVGDIGSLEIVNIASLPERASAYGVRSVPWLRLGPFELEGARTEGDIRHWLGKINSVEGMAEYMADLLANGNLNKVIHLVNETPELLHHLVSLLGNSETELKVQLGIAAVFEDLAGSSILENIVLSLAELTKHSSSKVRADAAHYLSFTGDPTVIPYLEALRNDENRDVREIAVEAIDDLVNAKS